MLGKERKANLRLEDAPEFHSVPLEQHLQCINTHSPQEKRSYRSISPAWEDKLSVALTIVTSCSVVIFYAVYVWFDMYMWREEAREGSKKTGITLFIANTESYTTL